MLVRTLTALVALLICVPILIWGNFWAVGIAFAFFCAVSMAEMINCCGLSKKWLMSVLTIAFSVFFVILPLILRMQLFGAIGFMLVMIPVLLIGFMFYGVLTHKTTDIERLMMFFSLAVYITAGFTALSVLRLVFGVWAVALVLCIAWVTDTFAYFSGMLFGKKKLCPDISPKKTVAGAIGGTLFGTLSGFLVFWLADLNPLFGIIALPLSIVSQLGDLSASVIKRKFGVKDYGKLFPGHGGVLDRFDSIIPVAVFTSVILIVIFIL